MILLPHYIWKEIVTSHLNAEKNASVIAKLHINHQNILTQKSEIKSFLDIFFIFLNQKYKNGLNNIDPKKCSIKTKFNGEN